MTSDEKIIKLLEEIRDQQKTLNENSMEFIKASEAKRQKLLKKIMIGFVIVLILNFIGIVLTSPH